MMSRTERFFVPVVLIGLTGLIYGETTTFPAIAARFPKLLIASLFLLSSILLFQEWRTRNVAHQETPEKETIEASAEAGSGLVSPKARQILILVSLVAYIILLEYLGFLVTTFLFLLVQFSLLGYRKKSTILTTTICITAVVFLVFEKIFLIIFPEGVILPALF
jgi:putative tricarboxylic transport membrane protein